MNDSLVFIDFANRKRREGATLHDAVVAAGIQRFRPIILTTLTTFLGLMPMILETGKVHPAVSGLNQLTTAISKMSSMLELCPAARARGVKTTSKTQRQANNEKDWLNAINVPAADSAPRKKRSARIHS